MRSEVLLLLCTEAPPKHPLHNFRRVSSTYWIVLQTVCFSWAFVGWPIHCYASSKAKLPKVCRVSWEESGLAVDQLAKLPLYWKAFLPLPLPVGVRGKGKAVWAASLSPFTPLLRHSLSVVPDTEGQGPRRVLPLSEWSFFLSCQGTRAKSVLCNGQAFLLSINLTRYLSFSISLLNGRKNSKYLFKVLC